MQSFTQTRTSLSGQTKTRTLHTAPPQERLLQKIVARGLSERLDNMQHPASYGYRPKRSRQMAVKALKKLIEQNRPWILESDIADCFDSIPHSIIRSRLASLINDDITTDFILRVISALRQNAITGIGIPQGSPLSPLLANIVLRDLDYDLSQQNYHHIRYADDFVICCRTPEEAQQAEQACIQSLSEQQLTLKLSKTHLKQISEGLIFLGYHIDEQTIQDLSAQTAEQNLPLIEQDGINPITPPGQTLIICRNPPHRAQPS
ncbi:reverse transcriptase/maturase family protein [Suttonella ornithocola]|nr:reverse transcriptase/maturase family protein [Suttonella ornithocola]